MPRTVKTREGVFILAGVLAGVGLVLAVSGSSTAFTAILLIASAGVLAAGVAMELLAFLRPGAGELRRHASEGVEVDCDRDAPSSGGKVDGAR